MFQHPPTRPASTRITDRLEQELVTGMAGIHRRDPLDLAQPCQSHYLHADAASNYDALYRQHPRIKPVNCWAHARRKFYAIAKESSSKLFAHEAVEQIDVLFAMERQWCELSDEARQEKRQSEAIPQLEHIHTMMSAKLIQLGPNTVTAGAISYLLKRWDNFTRYTERGGEAAAIYYSLIETAKANGIEPSAWLLNTLRELPKRKGSSFQDVKDLLPIKGAEQL